MKKILLFAAIWLHGWLCLAQTEPNLQQQLDEAFSQLNQQDITTGILLDRTYSFSNIHRFDGKFDTACTYGNWQQLYKEYYNASFEREGLLPLDELRDKAFDKMKTEAVPLLVVLFRYNTLLPNAEELDLIYKDSVEHKIYDVPGRSSSPYTEHYAFAVSFPLPLFYPDTINFYFGREFIFGNVSPDDAAFEIDFGDGNGYQPIALEDTKQIIYTESGGKLIRIKWRKNDDKWQATGTVNKVATVPAPDLVKGFVADRSWPGQTEFGAGKIYVQLGNGNRVSDGNTAKKLCKPFIFVEGIDFGMFGKFISDSIVFSNWNGNITQITPPYQYGTAGWSLMHNYDQEYPSQEKLPVFRTQMLQQGYDMIFVDFRDGAALIQQNAMFLVKLIQWLNDPQNRNCNNELIIAGASMGGQVVRFALSYMEQENLPHCSKLYVSFDSPHRGANVPLGIQYMLKELESVSPAAEDNIGKLLQPASKQMLVYHHSSDADSYRNSWQGWQASANSYPTKLRKIAVSNGSRLGNNQGYNGGAMLIESSLWGITLTGRHRCYALPGTTIGNRSNVVYKKDRNGLLVKDVIKDVSGSIPPQYDSAPGCISFVAKEIHKNAPSHFDKNSIRQNCFMPTVSTLDIHAAGPIASANLWYDIAGNINPNRPDATKYHFDAYFAPDNNEPHVQITDGQPSQHGHPQYGTVSYNNIDWIKNEILQSEHNLPAQLTTVYNFGNSNRNLLASVTVNNNGRLLVNNSTFVVNGGTGNPSYPPAGNFQLITGGCGPYVQLNTGGQFELGGANTTTHQATVFFKSGSTLDMNGGKLVINNGSKLVIEENATLLMSQNSVIELNGDNAVLEIKVNLNLTAGVTFTFTTAPGQNTGYVKFSGSGNQNIITALNSRLEFTGNGMADKVLEISPNTWLNYSNWNNLAEIKLRNCTVDMKAGSKIYLIKNPDIDYVHFSGNTASRYHTVEIYGVSNKIKNSKFEGGQYGIALFQNSGNQSVLADNRFSYNTTGVRAVNGAVKFSNCQVTHNDTGWKMEAGGISETNNSSFNNYNVNIDYTSNAGGSLNLVKSSLINSSTGIIFDGAGTLRGNCSFVNENYIGALVKNNAFVNFSGTGTVASNMEFNNYYHNILFEKGAGLNFQNGSNQFNSADGAGNYRLSTSPSRGTAAISGEIIESVLASNPNKVFYADKNSWNLATPADPLAKDEVFTYQGSFDYYLFSQVGTGPHPTIYWYNIEDGSPVARRSAQQYEYVCGAATDPGGGGGISRMASNTTASSTGTYNPAFTSTSTCTQYQPLLQAVQQAASLQIRNNPNGNDYLAFVEIQSALQLVQPDTCREFNQLLEQAYRLMRETYTASLVTDTTVTAFNKLNLANQVTDVFLGWSQQRADTSGMYYIWMDKALNSYAADDLAQANWSLNNAWNFVNATNTSYVQYWTCLLNARRQLNDSTINATQFFALLDSCQNTYGNTGGMASRMGQSAKIQSPLKLYPNPAEDKTVVNFDLKQAEPVIIELLDVNGTVLESIRQDETITGKQEVTMPLGNRRTGIYFIRVYGKSFNQSGRLSIVR